MAGIIGNILQEQTSIGSIKQEQTSIGSIKQEQAFEMNIYNGCRNSR